MEFELCNLLRQVKRDLLMIYIMYILYKMAKIVIILTIKVLYRGENMEILQGTEIVKNNGIEKTAIAEFRINDYVLYAFQGSLSDNDIYLKYRKYNNGVKSRIRTPQHIHWIVDLLMKRQANSRLTLEFVRKIKNIWIESTPLTNNDFDSLKQLVINKSQEIEINRFVSLKSGEYDIEFLYTLIVLLIYQEKTNRSDSYLMGKIIDAMSKEELDIFAIISAANLRGR